MSEQFTDNIEAKIMPSSDNHRKVKCVGNMVHTQYDIKVRVEMHFNTIEAT